MGGTVMRRNNVFHRNSRLREEALILEARPGVHTPMMVFWISCWATCLSATVGVAPLHGRPNQFWLAGYFQDDYKVSTNLTVNLGIRYDYFQPWKEMRDHWATFDLATNQLVYCG